MLKIVPPVATSVHDANSLSNTNRNALAHKRGATYYQTKVRTFRKGSDKQHVGCMLGINKYISGL